MKKFFFYFLILANSWANGFSIDESRYEDDWRPAVSERVRVEGGEFITVLAAASSSQWDKALYVVIEDDQSVEHPIIWDKLPSTIEQQNGTPGTYIIGVFNNVGENTIVGDVKVRVGKMSLTVNHENGATSAKQDVEVIVMITAAEPSISSATMTVLDKSLEQYYINATIENFTSLVEVPTKADPNKYWANIEMKPVVLLKPIKDEDPSIQAGSTSMASDLVKQELENQQLIKVSIKNELACMSNNGNVFVLTDCLLETPDLLEGQYSVHLGIESFDSLDAEGNLVTDPSSSLLVRSDVRFNDVNIPDLDQNAKITVPSRNVNVKPPTIFAVASSAEPGEKRKLFIRWAPYEGIENAIDGYELSWRNSSGVLYEEAETIYTGKSFQYDLEVPTKENFNLSGQAEVLSSYEYDPKDDDVNKPSNYSLSNEDGSLGVLRTPKDRTISPSTFADELTLTLTPVRKTWKPIQRENQSSTSDENENSSASNDNKMNIMAAFVPVTDLNGQIVPPLEIIAKSFGIAESNPNQTNKLTLIPQIFDANSTRQNWDGITPFTVSLDGNLAIPITIKMENIEPFWDNTSFKASPYIFGEMLGSLIETPEMTESEVSALSKDSLEDFLKINPTVNAFASDFMFVGDSDYDALIAEALTGSAQSFTHETSITFRPNPKTLLCGDLHPRIPAYKIKKEITTYEEFDWTNSSSVYDEGDTIPTVMGSRHYWVLDLNQYGNAQVLKDDKGKVVYIEDLSTEQQVGPNEKRSICDRLYSKRTDLGLSEIPPREIPIKTRSKVGEYKVRFSANNLAYRGPLDADYNSPSYGSYVILPIKILPPKPSFLSLKPADTSPGTIPVDIRYIVSDRSQDFKLAIDGTANANQDAIDGKTILTVYNQSGVDESMVGPKIWQAELPTGISAELLLQEAIGANSEFSQEDQQALEHQLIDINFKTLLGTGTYSSKTLFQIIDTDEVHTLKLSIHNEEKGRDGTVYIGSKTYVPYLINYVNDPKSWECDDFDPPASTSETILNRRVNFLGIYPRSTSVNLDFEFGFNRMYDLDPDHWQVDLVHELTHLKDIPFSLSSNGFTLNMQRILTEKAPLNSSFVGDTISIYVFAKGIDADNTGCPTLKSESLKGTIIIEDAVEPVKIIQEGGGFKITNINPNLRVEYAIGRPPGTDWRNNLKFKPYHYNSTSKEGQIIDVEHSGLITISMTPKSLFQGTRTLIHKVILVNSLATIYDAANIQIAPEAMLPYVPDVNGSYRFPASGSSALGNKLFIFPKRQNSGKTTKVRYLCKINEEDPFVCPLSYDGLPLEKPGTQTLRIWAQSWFYDENDTELEHSSSPILIEVHNEVATNEETITSDCYEDGYPLLLKLDAGKMPNWNATDWANVSQQTLFLSSETGQKLAFEVEKVAGQSALIWVSAPKPKKVGETYKCGIKISLVSNNNTNSIPDIWSEKYQGVYHMLEDVTTIGEFPNSVDSGVNLNAATALPLVSAIGDGVSTLVDSPSLINKNSFLSKWDFGFTWSAWVRKDDLSAMTSAISLFKTDKNLVQLDLEANGVLSGVIGKSAFVSQNRAFIEGEWNHLAFTYSNGSDAESFKVFVNGKTIISDYSLKNTILGLTEGVNISIGAELDYLDEVRLSNLAISPKWIAWDYKTQHPIGFAKSADQECKPKIYGLSKRFVLNCDLNLGDKLFSDLSTSFNQLPDELIGGVQVQTANSEYKVNLKEYLGFEIRQSSVAFLLVDPAYTTLPSFLAEQGWSQVEFAKSVTTSRSETWNIWQKIVSPMEKLKLGGARHSGGLGNNWNYTLVVKNIKAKELNSCGVLQPGTKTYTDKDWVVTYASGLGDFDVICTEQDDYTSSQEEAFAIDLAKTRYVYVGIDTKSEGIPDFIKKGWAKVPDAKVKLNAPAHEGYHFYKTKLAAGRYWLSGMRSGATDNEFNYIVLAEKVKIDFPDDPSVDITHPSKVGDISILDMDPIFDGTKGRQVCKDVANSMTSVKVVGPVRVYALYPDAFYPNTFAYLQTNGWIKTDLHFLVAEYEQPLTVWSYDVKDGSQTLLLPCYNFETEWKDKEYPLVILGPIYHDIIGYRMQNLKVVVNPVDKVQSSEYTLSDVEYNWAKGKTSNVLYSMEVNSIAAIYKPLSSKFVLTGYGISGSHAVETGSGEVLIAQSLNLADLMPTLIQDQKTSDEDPLGIVVSAENLQASGVVRLHFTNAGKSDLTQKFNVILFDDLDGDFAFDAKVDSYLGETSVEGIAQGDELSVDIPVYNYLSFPEKSIMAFMDPDSWVAESNKLNNLMLSDLKCNISQSFYNRESEDWQTVDAVTSQIPSGAITQLALIQDTNNDGSINDDDFASLLVYNAGVLKAINAFSGDLIFSEAISTNVTAINVRDLNYDGAPEIILNHEVRTAAGGVWLDFNDTDTWQSLDLNHDQIKERIVLATSCSEIINGISNEKLSDQNCVTAVSLHDIVVLTNEQSPCFDMSLSYPRRELNTLWVRFANNSTSALVSQIPLVLYEKQSGTWVKIAEALTVENLNPEKIQDIPFDLGDSYSWTKELKVVVEDNSQKDLLYYEFNMNNNEIIYTP